MSEIKNKSNDINLILLKNRVKENKQQIIEDYIELLKDCRTAQDFYSLLEQLYDEAVYLTGEWIIEKQISKNAEVLEELRKNF